MEIKNLNLDSFFMDGYYKGKVSDFTDYDISIFDRFKISHCASYECDIIDPAAVIELKELQQFFAEHLIKILFDEFELVDIGMWEGVDDGTSDWHNDWQDGDNFSSNILIYLDDNTKENGNNIQVRSHGNEIGLYPKRGEFIWLNQKSCFEHKATYTSGVRRVLSLEYMVPELTT